MDARATRCAIKADDVLREIARMAFSNMYDYIRIQEDGSPVVDLSALNRDTAAAIQEVTVDTYMEGRGKGAREVKRLKFKLADKARNLDMLGRHLKLFGVKTDDFGEDGEEPPPATVHIKVVDGRKR